jgi:ABC-2 type transport system ATP-binding protein
MLILDEPLSGLDPVGRRDVVDILMEFRHQGGTLFFSSHVLHDVERLADRFGLIHKGKLRTVQHPGELMDDGDARTVIRSSGADPVAGMSADVAGRWFVELPAKDVWSMLDTLRSAGHTIIEVRQKLSLEQIFMQYIEKDANP